MTIRRLVTPALVFLVLSIFIVMASSLHLQAEGPELIPDSKQYALGYDYALYINRGSAYGFHLYARSAMPPKKYFPRKLLDGVKAVSAGEDHYFILKENGDLYAFGSNEYGQLGDGTTDYRQDPKLVMTDVKAVAGGSKFSLVVKNDFSLWSFGLNDRGQLGLGHNLNQLSPVKVMDDILRVSAGVEHSLVLTTKGELYGFGDNSFGQLGLGNLKEQWKPAKIMQSIEYMSAGASHSLALSFQGQLYHFGSNFFGEGLKLEFGYSTKPVSIKEAIGSISAGYGGSFLLDKQGKISYHGLTGEADLTKKWTNFSYKPLIFNNSFRSLGSHAYDSAMALGGDDYSYLLAKKPAATGPYMSLALKDFLDTDRIGFSQPRLPRPQYAPASSQPPISALKVKLGALKQYFKTFYPPPAGKLIAITFDDGPSNYTDELLEALKANESRATFFVLGSSARYYTAVLKKMKAYDCEIASHSFNHSDYTLLSPSEVREDLKSTDAIIEAAVGLRPDLFRPPYGAYNDETLSVLASMGKAAVLWDIDTRDWANRDSAYVRDYLLNYAKDGSILLLHDIHRTSVDGFLEALPELINRGYLLVTVSELMEYKGKSIQPGDIIFSAR